MRWVSSVIVNKELLKSVLDFIAEDVANVMNKCSSIEDKTSFEKYNNEL